MPFANFIGKYFQQKADVEAYERHYEESQRKAEEERRQYEREERARKAEERRQYLASEAYRVEQRKNKEFREKVIAELKKKGIYSKLPQAQIDFLTNRFEQTRIKNMREQRKYQMKALHNKRRIIQPFVPVNSTKPKIYHSHEGHDEEPSQIDRIVSILNRKQGRKV